MDKSKEADRLMWKVSNALRGIWAEKGGRPAFECADYFAVYALYLMRNRAEMHSPIFLGPDQGVVDALLGEPADEFARSVIEEDLSYTSVMDEAEVSRSVVDAALALDAIMPDLDVRAYLSHAPAHRSPAKGNEPTSESIAGLALRLLEIGEGDSVADLGCGEGGFILRALDLQPRADYTGVEIDNLLSLIASIRFRALGARVEIEPTCALDLKVTEDVSFDRVFASYPFGLRFRNMDWINDGSGAYVERLARFGEPASADWVFCWNAADCTRRGGKAVAVISCGSACNKREAEIRRDFVESGLIESVVALPEKMHEGTNAATLMLVLSHGNEGVRFVDATKAFQSGRRRNSFSADDIEAIARACSEDSDMSAFASVDDIGLKGWDLMPETYLQADVVVENGVPIEELVEYIGRGSTADASSLDEKASLEDSPFKYVRIQDISDGAISRSLPSLVEMPTKLRPAFVEDGDVLVSRSGAPVKVAYAEVAEGETVVAIGNVYILRFDEDAVNPLYAAAFLFGKTGSELIYRACQKTGIPSLPMDNLRKIPIPMLPRAEQDEIALKFKAKLDEVSRVKDDLDRLRRELAEAAG